MVDTNTELLEAMKQLRGELRTLTDRVATLEGAKAAVKPAAVASEKPTAVSAPPAPAPEPIPEEILLVISAAVAAFLGKRAPVRQIRLISSSGWATQGRVSIQASHNLNR